MNTKQPITQDISGCLEKRIGQFGLSQNSLDNWSKKAEEILSSLREDYKKGDLPLFDICNDTQDIKLAELALSTLQKNAETIIFFGTGGSALGGQTLAQVGGWNIPYDKQCVSANNIRIRFIDNLDSRSLSSLLTNLDLIRTRFVVTSKSGTTIETLTQTITALSAVKEAGLSEQIPNMFLGITEPASSDKNNGLRNLFDQYGINILDHPTGIGGRFSCLSVVGLLPAITRGLDPYLFRAGANSILEPLLKSSNGSFWQPCVQGAALNVGLSQERGVRNVVMMPYSDRLAKFSEWFVQLWAESLGKRGSGTCPIPALGPLDQHSQLQFFMDGPNDMVFTIVRPETKGTGPTIDFEMAKKADLSYLGGKTVGDIVFAQGQAVATALVKAQRPVRTIEISKLDEYSVGALLMHFMIETIIAGRLLGINPFDQPGVELAKVLTKHQLMQ